MVVVVGIWGVGQGLYLAADQALGYALIPDQREASRYFGLMSVATAVGAAGGGAICSGLLYVFGALLYPEQIPSDGAGYSFPGYMALFLSAVCLNLACFWVLRGIKVGDALTEDLP